MLESSEYSIIGRTTKHLGRWALKQSTTPLESPGLGTGRELQGDKTPFTLFPSPYYHNLNVCARFDKRSVRFWPLLGHRFGINGKAQPKPFEREGKGFSVVMPRYSSESTPARPVKDQRLRDVAMSPESIGTNAADTAVSY